MPAQTQDMPLQQELGLVNYLRSVTGTAGSGGTAVAGQAEDIDSQGLSNIMTEWLRGNGQFLEKMQQQNQSGLYNSSTRRLVANDLTAQAALKAATASTQVRMENAKLQTMASIENAKRGTAGGSSRTDSILNALMAAGINKFASNSAKEAMGIKKDKKKQSEAEKVETGAAAGAGMESLSPASSSDGGYDYQDYSNAMQAADYQNAGSPDYSAESFGGDYSGMDFSPIASSGDINFGGDGGGFDFNLGSGDVYDYQDYSGADIGVGGGDYQDYNFDFGSFDEWGW